MNSKKENNSSQIPKWSKYINLKSMLSIFIFFALLLVGCYDDLTDTIVPEELDDPIIHAPSALVGSGATGSATSFLFEAAGKSVAKEVAGEFTKLGLGWAMGALGVTYEANEVSEQLGKIDEDLLEIIDLLGDVTLELADINHELLVLDCSEQQTALTTETGRIDFLIQEYQSYMSTASQGGLIPPATLADWVDQVLAKNAYAGQTPMGQILTTVANKLLQPNSGAITACIKTIPSLENNSFSDLTYYDAVSHFTQYYYSYQATGLMMLVEALHYQAWVAAGSPVDIDADSVSVVCQNPNALGYCTEAATFTNGVYNALVAQFTAAGAPYTTDDLLMQNHQSNPVLWIRSLEDFTRAAGYAFIDPLVSDVSGNDENDPYPYGPTSGLWNDPMAWPHIVHYRGYSEWTFASSDHLNILLNGWSSGTTGNFLETERGFKYMTEKLIIANNTVSITLERAPESMNAVPFIDGTIDHSFQSGVVDDAASFNRMTKLTKQSKACNNLGYAGTNNIWTDGTPITVGWRNSFYRISASYWTCDQRNKIIWSSRPGWHAENLNNKATQYRWPVGSTALFTNHATEGRSTKNVAGVWTMCGDDFTAWLNNVVPRPSSCDDSSLSPCTL